jgi:microcystin-dependent protein
MSQFLGEIRMFSGNFAPRGWALCDGQLLPITANSSLFSVLGTTYGGDGVSTFGLPDLRGRLPMHAGTGPGLTPRSMGQAGGAETTTLTVQQLPAHTHALNASSQPGDRANPDGATLAAFGTHVPPLGSYNGQSPDTDMRSNSIGDAGNGQPFDALPPFCVVNFIIAITGEYPSRS